MRSHFLRDRAAWWPPTATRVALGVVWLLFVWQGLVTLRSHEPWRDEVQVWLLARDADLGSHFSGLSYEGRPGAWDLLILPFAKSGLPFFTLSLLHFGLAAAVVAIVFRFAPFPVWMKIAFAFSYFMFWEYAIPARIYVLGILGLFSAAAVHRDRFQRPLWFAAGIAIMVNTSVHFFPLAGIITFVFGCECLQRRERKLAVWAALAVMILAGLVAYLQVRMKPDHPHLADGTFAKDFDYTAFPRALGNAFAVTQDANCDWVDASAPIEVAGGLFWGALLVLLVPNWTAMLLVLTHLAGQLYISGFMGGSLRHQGLILVGMIYAFWVGGDFAGFRPFSRLFHVRWWPSFTARRHVASVLLTLSFLASLPACLRMHAQDRQLDFSGSLRMARFLQQCDGQGCVIAVHRSYRMTAILPFLPGIRFWDPAAERYFTYIQYDLALAPGDRLTIDDVHRRIESRFPPEVPLFLLIDRPLPQELAPQYTELFQVDTTVFATDEKMYLYRRAGPRPAEGRRE